MFSFSQDEDELNKVIRWEVSHKINDKWEILQSWQDGDLGKTTYQASATIAVLRIHFRFQTEDGLNIGINQLGLTGTPLAVGTPIPEVTPTSEIEGSITVSARSTNWVYSLFITGLLFVRRMKK